MRQHPDRQAKLNTPECDCWGLTEILDSDKSIQVFDHVCPNTCRVACENWIKNSRLWQLQDDMVLPVIKSIQLNTTGQLTWPQQDDMVFPEIILPLPGQRFVRCSKAWWDAASKSVHLSPDNWPYRVSEEALSSLIYDSLYLVIRQWAEYPIEEYVLPIIYQTERWQMCCNRIRNKLEQKSKLKGDLDATWWAQYYLEDLGLPPGLAQHALDQIHPNQRSSRLPTPITRLLITSFIIKHKNVLPERAKLSHLPSKEDKKEDMVEFEIAGSSQFTPEDLFRKAAIYARDHKDWWMQLPGSHLLLHLKRGRPSNPHYEADYNRIIQTTSDRTKIKNFLVERESERRCKEQNGRPLNGEERRNVKNSVTAWLWRNHPAGESIPESVQRGYAPIDEESVEE